MSYWGNTWLPDQWSAADQEALELALEQEHAAGLLLAVPQDIYKKAKEANER